MALPRLITMMLHCASRDYTYSNKLGGINFDRKRNLMMATDGTCAMIVRPTMESVDVYLEALAKAKGVTDIPNGDVEVNIVNGYGTKTVESKNGRHLKGEFRWKIGDTFPDLFKVLPIGDHTKDSVRSVYDRKRFDKLFRAFKSWSGHEVKLSVSRGCNNGPLMQYGKIGQFEYVLAIMPVFAEHYDLNEPLPSHLAMVSGVPEPNMEIANRFIEIGHELRSISEAEPERK